MEKRIPRRRFKEFVGSGEWEEKKLGEILRTDSFRSYIKKPQFNGEHIVIQQGNDPVAGYADGDPYLDYEKVVLFGDHTLSLYKPKVPFFISTDGLKIIYGSNNMDSNFILYTLELYKPKNEGYKRYYSILKDKEVYISKNLAEQEKIGNFFKKLDRLIEINREKLDKLRASKSAYLTEMFPGEGEDRPRRRFQGFTGEWEEKKLGEVSEYIKGFAFKSKDYINKGTRIIRVSDLTRNEICFSKDTVYIDSRYSECYKKYRLIKNDIIITTVGSKTELKESAVGRAILVRQDNMGLLNQNLVKISALEGYNSFFIYCQLLQKGYSKYISTIERGNANQANIAIKSLWEYEFSIPSLAEQEKIGNFFQNLDQQIEVQEEKLEKLEKMKKAYLAEMFI